MRGGRWGRMQVARQSDGAEWPASAARYSHYSRETGPSSANHPRALLLDSRGCPPSMHAKAGHDEAARAARALSAWPLFASTGWKPSCHDDQPAAYILRSPASACLHHSPSLAPIALHIRHPRFFQRAAPPSPRRAPRRRLARHLHPATTLIAAPPSNAYQFPRLPAFPSYIIRCTPKASTHDIPHI